MNFNTKDIKYKVFNKNNLKEFINNIFNKVTDVGFLKKHVKRKGVDFTRTGKLPIENVASRIFVRLNKSLAVSISEYDKQVANTIREKYNTTANASASAFTQARDKLYYTAFKEILDYQVQMRYTLNENNEVFIKTNDEGFIEVAEDGMVSEIPNTEELKYAMGETSSQPGTIKNARMGTATLFDLTNRIILCSDVDEYPINEREATKNQVIHLMNTIPNFRCFDWLFIHDRGYVSYEMIAFYLKLDLSFIFRLPTDTFKDEISSMKGNDKWIKVSTKKFLENVSDPEIKKWLKEQGDTITLRFTKIPLSTGEIEILVSNLDMDRVTYTKMKQYYFKRWRNRSTL